MDFICGIENQTVADSLLSFTKLAKHFPHYVNMDRTTHV